MKSNPYKWSLNNDCPKPWNHKWVRSGLDGSLKSTIAPCKLNNTSSASSSLPTGMHWKRQNDPLPKGPKSVVVNSNRTWTRKAETNNVQESNAVTVEGKTESSKTAVELAPPCSPTAMEKDLLLLLKEPQNKKDEVDRKKYKRIGNNKLNRKLKKPEATPIDSTPAPSSGGGAKTQRKNDTLNHRPVKRRKETVVSQMNSAKRIRLASSTTDISLNGPPIPGIPPKGKSVETPDAPLTTFAYCQPTAKTHPGKPGTRTLSLFRVPATDQTRICPSFARGISCTEEKCFFRHDVPPEAAQPTCFYFSKFNGMCLKEDCPFRHVKGTAEPCPRFMKTGYCTLNNCSLDHFQHKNKTFTAAQLSQKSQDLVFYD